MNSKGWVEPLGTVIFWTAMAPRWRVLVKTQVTVSPSARSIAVGGLSGPAVATADRGGQVPPARDDLGYRVGPAAAILGGHQIDKDLLLAVGQ